MPDVAITYDHCEKGHEAVVHKTIGPCPLCLIEDYRKALYAILEQATRWQRAADDKTLLKDDLLKISKIADKAMV